ncbi:MAG: hypothetical protein HYZ27_01700, partial [Deltaproteobacteria bacterium]|nr:hypothetical protein [Deltaproteobacteria bacterium]
MKRFAALSALFLLVAAARAQEDPRTPRLEVAFEVDAASPESGRVRVVMKIAKNAADFLDVSMPCWRPGSYRLQNDFRHVKDLKGPGDVRRIDEMTWRVPAGGRDVTIEYDVAVPKERLDAEHFFFEGPSLYLYVLGHKDAPQSVTF